MAAHFLFLHWPDRGELGPRVSTMHFAPAEWSPADVAPLKLAGAWAISSNDPRVGGVSALTLDDGRFIAVTDSGVVLQFGRPSARPTKVLVNELPGGPARPGFKVNRDSEALAADPLGRGWWVAFETRNQLWLYDAGFERVLGRVDFGDARWRFNQGIEGLASGKDGIILFPEAGNNMLRWTGRSAPSFKLERPLG
ncbi:MAG TPA: esterase-like activity of phytase family protein, partial [Sphingomicrobium sp.]